MSLFKALEIWYNTRNMGFSALLSGKGFTA
jgi:hypothetical protein